VVQSTGQPHALGTATVAPKPRQPPAGGGD
jgi:hypothetical protein